MSNNPYKPGAAERRRRRTNTWLVVGVIILIVLLFGWLTLADMSGDTDVSSSANFAADNPPIENAQI